MSVDKLKIKIFISHGRDEKLNKELISWLNHRKKYIIEVIDFKRLVKIGETTSNKLPHLASEGDAAIILATPDDTGKLKSNNEFEDRARQNLWIEYGFFWAKLGLTRIALIRKGAVDIPSNIQTVSMLEIKDEIKEITEKLKVFLDSLYQQEPDLLTELIYTSSEPTKSDSQWKELLDVAQWRLSILGIANARLIHFLSEILKEMIERKKELILELLVMHPEYAAVNKKTIEDNHGLETINDNRRFYKKLYQDLKKFKSLTGRVIIYAYKCYPSFAVVIADGHKPGLGGSLIVRPFIRKAREGGFHYPHFKLKERSRNGTFVQFCMAVKNIIEDKETVTLNDHDSICRFIERLSLNED